MKIKITRKALMIFIASLGVFLIAYSVFRHFTGIGLPEEMEKWVMDSVIIIALGLFVYNRKLTRDEKREREEAERAEAAAEAGETAPEKTEEPADEEDLPHWERQGSDADDD